jgi:protein TonB
MRNGCSSACAAANIFISKESAMAPIAKENEVLTATTDAAVRPAAPSTLPSEGASKPQPVALEVAVTVNGARTVDGSDKREPFSESTKTVLVFGSGAVIRLQSPVAPGQLLFLTNEKTRKEVVCQVVKSKNYRNVSGYVELEFTEAVIGFWGVRFPNDRIGPQAVASGSPTPAVPAAQPSVTPAMPLPEAAANFAALKALSSAPVNSPANSQATSPKASSATFAVPTSAEASVAPPPVKTKPPAEIHQFKAAATIAPPVPEPAAPVASDPSTEALKQQTARLQEQLSSMLFVGKPISSESAPPLAATKEIHDTAAKILEFVKPEPPQAVPEKPKIVAEPTKSVQPIASAAAKSLLEAEEVQIPSWLEPLARNAANAAAGEEAAPKEEWRHNEEPILESYIAPEPAEGGAPEDAEAATLPFTTNFLEPEQPASRGSNKGLLIGAIAAVIVLAAAGGAWYMRSQPVAAPGNVSGAIVAPGGPARTPVQTSGQNSNGAATTASANLPAGSAAASSAYPAAGAGNAGGNVSNNVSNNASSNGSNNSSNAAVSNAVAKTPQPVPMPVPVQAQLEPTPKKPALGQVRLAAPTLNRNGQPQPANDAETGISLGNSDSAPSDSLGSGLAANANQPAKPAEPLPIGGDVKAAKLLTSVSPIYPSLAKSQHVAGDVRVDALIDANGRVTTMKIVSGPTLLHQAAMDALHQWKYQAATLDGKAVPMHLTVTLQFRLQ